MMHHRDTENTETTVGPRFTRGEYWLLETVVEMGVSVRSLASDDVALGFNKPSHGLSRPALARTILSLTSKGLIAFTDGLGEKVEPDELGIRKQLNNEVSQPGEAIIYFLTAEGGRQWESFAAPDWNSYLAQSFSSVHEAEGEALLIHADRSRLQRFLNEVNRADHWYEVMPGTIQWEVLSPWQATYWKQLPVGHQAKFRYRRKELQRDSMMPFIEALENNRGWYRWR